LSHLKWALAYAESARLSVFPVKVGGKSPLTKNGFKDATTDSGQITEWWSKMPMANIGIPIPAGIMVLDVDSLEALHMLKAMDLVLPSTVNAKTPRGWHMWYLADGIKPSTGLLPGLDVRAPGSYVVVPPSKAHNGLRYDWLVPPRENDFTDAPEWLIEMAKDTKLSSDGPTNGRVKPESVLEGVAEGSRDNTLFRYACRLRALDYPRAEAEILVGHAASSCSPPMSDFVARQKVESAWKYEPTVAKDGPASKEEIKIWSMQEFMAAKFPDPFWIIGEILPEGLTLLYSRSKAGKSFLVGKLCQNIANGEWALSKYPTAGCEILYLDLEQSEGLAQKRWEAVIGGTPMPFKLSPVFKWPRMDEGGLEKIDAYLEEHSTCRMVVIDVLSMFWPDDAKANGNAYHWEYKQLSNIRNIAHKHGANITLIHHTKKGASLDPLDMASGTRAMTGVPDTIWVLERESGSQEGKLMVTGKNVIEQTVRMSFQPEHGGWTYGGLPPW
jgi:hypothetical protein